MANNFSKNLKSLFAGYGLDTIEVSTGKPYIDPIIRFFRQRARRLRR